MNPLIHPETLRVRSIHSPSPFYTEGRWGSKAVRVSITARKWQSQHWSQAQPLPSSCHWSSAPHSRPTHGAGSHPVTSTPPHGGRRCGAMGKSRAHLRWASEMSFSRAPSLRIQRSRSPSFAFTGQLFLETRSLWLNYELTRKCEVERTGPCILAITSKVEKLHCEQHSGHKLV